jgi:hypothetical protein
MYTRPNPLVPLWLFKSRDFSVINLSTLLIYGALYSTFGFLGLFLQGVLGYTAFAAGLVGLPSGVMLTVLSTRVGTAAARIGARPFLVVGPPDRFGLLWYLRCRRRASRVAARPALDLLIPPLDTIVDILPAVLCSGPGSRSSSRPSRRRHGIGACRQRRLRPPSTRYPGFSPSRL